MAGRPKKPETDTLSYMLRIRMSEEDRELLEQAAKFKSLQLSSWARSELVALARKIIDKQDK
jgi:uncharacterized protein (DUF1778 family)